MSDQINSNNNSKSTNGIAPLSDSFDRSPGIHITHVSFELNYYDLQNLWIVKNGLDSIESVATGILIPKKK